MITIPLNEESAAAATERVSRSKSTVCKCKHCASIDVVPARMKDDDALVKKEPSSCRERWFCASLVMLVLLAIILLTGFVRRGYFNVMQESKALDAATTSTTD